MAWNGLRLTVDGRDALNRAQMENKLAFRAVVVGDGQPPGNFNVMKGLVHQLYEITEIQVDAREGMCVLTADFPSVDYDYYFREIGVIAATSEGDKLYVYDNCGDDAQYIVSTTGVEKTRKRIRLSLKISDVAEITVVNPEILYVAYDDFERLAEKVKTKVEAVGGDASNMVSDAEEPENPETKYPDINQQSPVKQILGYLYRWVKSLKADKVSTTDIVNNCTSAAADKPLAAAQGKVLWDKIVDAVAALTTHKTSGDHDGRYYTESEMDTKLGGKADTGHIHDDRYYTESEMDTKLDAKVSVADVVDNCTSTATNKPLSAKQGKTLWDKVTDAVSALTTHKTSGDHDGRYYTESEMNTKLNGKSDTSHNHDSTYVKIDGTADVGGIQVGNKATNGYGWIDIYLNKVLNYSIYPTTSGLNIKSTVSGSITKMFNFINGTLMQDGNAVLTYNDLVDNCTSTSTQKALTAKQGKVLMDKCNQLNSDLHDNLASVVLWKQYSINVGVLKPNANRYDQKATISLPSGYTSAAIAGFGLDGSGYTSCTITKLQVIGNAITWSVENRGVSDTGNLTLLVDILLFKSK